MQTQSLKVPGLPCPNCQTPIVIDPMLLLSAAPISCAACGLELQVNAEKSADTLNALQSYMNAFNQVQTDFSNKTADMTGGDGNTNTAPTRGRRPPKRRPRRA